MTQTVSISLECMWAIAQQTYNENPTLENLRTKLELESQLLQQINR
jgi:hypothetical protein